MLEQAHRFFSSRLYDVTLGRYFQGQLQQIPVSETTNSFIPARRFVKTDADSIAMPGHVIRTVSGQNYLSARRGVAEFQDKSIFKTMRLYEVTDIVPVTVAATANDSILGRPVSSGTPTTLVNNLYCAIEPTALEPDGMKTVTKIVRIITNMNLPNKALINGMYEVTDSNYESGLYFLTANKL